MEGHLLFPWNKYATLFPNDDQEIRQVSDKVTKHAQEMLVNALKAKFPAAAVALKVCLHPPPLEKTRSNPLFGDMFSAQAPALAEALPFCLWQLN